MKTVSQLIHKPCAGDRADVSPGVLSFLPSFPSPRAVPALLDLTGDTRMWSGGAREVQMKTNQSCELWSSHRALLAPTGGLLACGAGRSSHAAPACLPRPPPVVPLPPEKSPLKIKELEKRHSASPGWNGVLLVSSSWPGPGDPSGVKSGSSNTASRASSKVKC